MFIVSKMEVCSPVTRKRFQMSFVEFHQISMQPFNGVGTESYTLSKVNKTQSLHSACVLTKRECFSLLDFAKKHDCRRSLENLLKEQIQK